MNISAATPARPPKTPGSATRGQEEVTPRHVTAPSTTRPAVMMAFETPRRQQPSSIRNGCSAKTSNSVSKATSSRRMSSGNDGSAEGKRTPSLKGGSCAICLSPLKKSGGVEREVYTVQLCRHNFHRDCLTENRRAGNEGCPYCRGELEPGLTPEASAAEREAKAQAERQQEQREAIRNAAGRARTALARSLRLGQEALAREVAASGSRDSTLVQSR